MAFHPPKPVVPLLAIAMGAMVLSAAAQQSGQSIIFSAPPDDGAQSATPPLTPSGPQPVTLPGAMQAPVSPFNYSPPNNRLILPPPPANSAEQQRMKQLLDDRKNWTLMTPEEILGVTTTQKPAERDALGREKNPSQLERYLERENQSLTGRTNGWQTDRENSPWNLTHGQDWMSPLDSRRNSPADASSQDFDSSHFFNKRRNLDASASENGNTGWNPFDTPPPQTPVKPNLEQQAAMERFRQLLAPSPAATEPAPNSRFFTAPKPAADPFLTPPAFTANPAGVSFTPLSSGISRPTGLTPLPGITTPVSHPAAAPSWAPQPPPWAAQTPPPFSGPQWKF